MRTSSILLWIAVAGLAAVAIYQARQTRIQTPVKVNLTPVGVRVPIKNGNYEKFEQVLNTEVDPNGQNGTCVNILYQDPSGQWQTVNGPPFTKPQGAQQDGSMHVTQSILLSGLDQLNDVLSLLDTEPAKPTRIQAQCP
jgi:hypothetical protein